MFCTSWGRDDGHDRCPEITMATNLFGHDGTLDSAGHSINAGSHAEVVEPLVLLPDGVLRVDPGTLHVALLQRLGGGGGG